MKILIGVLIVITNISAFSDDVSNIKFIEDGVQLYESYFFESSLGSDKFFIADKNHRQIVPPGAVLLVIKPSYTIGFYEGKIEVDKEILKKIIFIINSDATISFHHPLPDGVSLGKKIESEIRFL